MSYFVRVATAADIDTCQRIARSHSKWLPFVRRDSLRRAIDCRELFVADSVGAVVGFVNWHGRRDGWSTVYDLAVSRGYEGQGIGRALLYAVMCPIRLKCTADNPANTFYRNAGMSLATSETARSGRALNVYEMRVLACIVRGNKANIPAIARSSGQAYGVMADDKAHDWPFMVDINWLSYDWSTYLGKVKALRPVMAMVADYMGPEHRDVMLSQVADLRAAGVLRVMVCPKWHGAIADIPPDCVVAVSLRTRGRMAKGDNKFAGFMPNFEELTGRMVHLLGGAPRLQKDTINKLQAVGARVLSVDGNAHIGAAERGSVYKDGLWQRKAWEPVDLLNTQLLSSVNIQRELNAAAGWSQLPLFAQVMA